MAYNTNEFIVFSKDTKDKRHKLSKNGYHIGKEKERGVVYWSEPCIFISRCVICVIYITNHTKN